MWPKRTSRPADVAIRVVIVTLDHHASGAIDRVRESLAEELPGLDLRLHATSRFDDAAVRAACLEDLARADIVFANMLFIDEHIRVLLPALSECQDRCDALVCAMSAGEVMRLTRMGSFRMDGEDRGPLALLKKLRGSQNKAKDGGAGQLAMLRRIPKLLRFVPGKAQDLRAYLMILSYWLSGSHENLANLVRLLVTRYADGPRRELRGSLDAAAPREYPEVGLYHPRLEGRVTESLETLREIGSPAAPSSGTGAPPRTVGLLLLRSYILADDAAHYDGVIAALEGLGLRVIPAFAAGLDARPAIERFFTSRGTPTIDALVSLTGFSLVGGPAFNDARAAEEVLAQLDVPYLAAQPLEFQSVATWAGSATGLTPLEATLMVSIPELDGAVGPRVFGGRDVEGAARASGSRDAGSSAMRSIPYRARMLAARVEKLIALRRTPREVRNVAIVLFNFPPNGGATGTAAFLSVFESLHRVLRALREDGYDVEVPPDVAALRAAILEGNAAQHGTDANVLLRVPTDEHVRRTRHLAEIEKQWGPAPGQQLSDGRSIFVLGARFGRVVVGVQPGFGTEGDPMRLLFSAGSAPTHAFAAFYRALRDSFDAHVVVHFGTHGALEFMPGKQVGLSDRCWPDRLIGDLPNVYLYASNNPSEGALARRRSAATLVSYLTPPIARSGLYRDLLDLRASLDRWQSLPPGDPEASRMVPTLQAMATALDLAVETPWDVPEQEISRLRARVLEIEQSLIPSGLHVLGQPMSVPARRQYLEAMLDARGAVWPPSVLDALASGRGLEPARAALERSAGDLTTFEELADTARLLSEDHEIPALLRALDARYIRPAPGGDLLRNPEVLPTGRNLHGFDPFSLPSAFALVDGARQVDRLLRHHLESGHAWPRSVAVVLWGADNLKSGGGPIGQVLALLGARPRFDSYGRLAGAELIPLEALARPRIDVLVTLSGIFRDLLPLQTRMLAEAAFLAASADEPLECNFVRTNALEYQRRHGGDLATAALRVFSNAQGAYGANVNHLVESGAWDDDDQLAETYSRRKCFAYRADGVASSHREVLDALLGEVELAYQNLESVEVGVTTLDQYFDTLGGISRAAARARGSARGLPVYIGDQTQSEAKVRTLAEQVALESRTRSLNPKWADAMLEHGAEGVRLIEAQVTNTLGWSATTQQVQPWVYRELTRTYVLDTAMRERLAELNPRASLKLANRLIEASERRYWSPDPETLAALRAAGDDLEDRLEGIAANVA
jgi:magnesium chelatase subunit H